MIIEEERDDFEVECIPHCILGVKALWVEVMRRAAFDWVLYAGSCRPLKRQLAQDAYSWLFLEDLDNSGKCFEGYPVNSFLGICESLDLDPVSMRAGIRGLTLDRVKSLGKLPTRRRRYDTSTETGHDDLEFRSLCASGVINSAYEASEELFGD